MKNPRAIVTPTLLVQGCVPWHSEEAIPLTKKHSSFRYGFKALSWLWVGAPPVRGTQKNCCGPRILRWCGQKLAARQGNFVPAGGHAG